VDNSDGELYLVFYDKIDALETDSSPLAFFGVGFVVEAKTSNDFKPMALQRKYHPGQSSQTTFSKCDSCHYQPFTRGNLVSRLSMWISWWVLRYDRLSSDTKEHGGQGIGKYQFPYQENVR
jgi:hypothetical protein